MLGGAACGSASAVVRWALFHEGRNAFARIAVVQVAHEVVALMAQLGMQAHGGRVVRQLFDAGQRIRRARVESLAQSQGFAQRFTGAADRIDHAQLLQALGRDALATHQQLQRGGPWHGAHKAPGGTAVWGQTHVAVGHDEHAVVRGHHHVAGQCQ